MRRRGCVRWFLLIAFLIQLQTGQELFIGDAVGFAMIEREVDGVKTQCLGFFNKKHEPLLAIPSEYVRVVVYLPEHGVM